MSETVERQTEPQGAGAMLRQAREAAGVHVAALAVALKVPVRQLEALEQDHLDLLPDHTFARALAGSVCRHLRTDPKPILARMPQGLPRAMPVGAGINEPFRNSSAPGRYSMGERLLRPPVLVALALLLGALVLILLPLFDDDEESAPAVAPTIAPALPQGAPAPVATASGGVVLEPVTPNMVPSVPATAAASGIPAAPPAATASPRQP